MRKSFIILFLFVLPGIFYAQSTSNRSKAKSIIEKMSLEEKAMMAVGMGMRFPGAPAPAVGQTDQKVEGAAGTTYSLDRLGITTMVFADGPAGVRIAPVRKNDSSKTYYATGFPVATLLASSWDTGLVEKIGSAFGNEVLEYGVDILLAPGMNIHRNPLGGRNFEYYSEDPLVTGKMSAALVRGVQSHGVGTSIKHFAANNQESNRMEVNTIVSQRALREIYLRGFEIAVKEGKPWTVMSSYNKINGTYASENYDLLTKILKDDWKFEGFVMSDWFGGKDAAAQMTAGNDLLMPGRSEQKQQIITAVKNGTLSEEALDENVTRIISIMLGSPSARKYNYSDKPNLKANAELARSAATEGMVLLKNENSTLPLKTGLNIALFGNASFALIAGGTGSGDVNKAYVVSLEEGLINAGFKTDNTLKDAYTKHIVDFKAKNPKKNFFMPAPVVPQMELSQELIERKAGESDMALITVGRNSGEFSDRKLEDDFYLSEREKRQIKNISEAFHAKGKKVVIVLNIGGVIETTSWRDYADAVLLAWQPGQEGGNAVADILVGKVNPSGKLATTFPVDYKDVPSAANFPGVPKEKPEEVIYEEGIYVGYRYYNTFNIKPAYEFGYGLSYTSFDYSDLKLSESTLTDKITVSLRITNTGSIPGKEAVQLYIAAPTEKLDKPAMELKAFAKTGLINPGESEQISFTITPADLCSFNTETSSWIAEEGKYTINAAASSLDIKHTASFNLPGEIVVEKVSNALAPQREIKEYKK